MAGAACSTGSAATASLSEVLERRSLATLFQPIFSFGEARMLGFEALVRGPEGSIVETPYELFGAAQREGRIVELNIVCIQEVLRAYARSGLPGLLFLNISPQLIVQPGFDRERAGRFLDSLGVDPGRVVIELTEDAGFDFGLVRESLRLYRAMGFRVAIDDLGEGFASLRLWSELEPEFVKADKHFVTGIARDSLKLQFLRAIQSIAHASGAQVIAEGIESADDFKLVKELGIACGQGWFIGRPQASPATGLAAAAAAANADERVRVAPLARNALPAIRHVQPLTRLPGLVPLHEHLEKLIARRLAFTVWVADVDTMEGFNDALGFEKGDALIHATARLIEAACEPGVDLAGHVAGTRFVVLAQSEGTRARLAHVAARFREILEDEVSAEGLARGYLVAESREGPRVRPLPRLLVAHLSVEPGAFESRHDVLEAAKAVSESARGDYRRAWN
jgi:EAL domain-containing protein (putative c-di-GMP-specific phosphodiesterase class I)/GGDEF domain-containing protein